MRNMKKRMLALFLALAMMVPSTVYATETDGQAAENEISVASDTTEEYITLYVGETKTITDNTGIYTEVTTEDTAVATVAVNGVVDNKNYTVDSTAVTSDETGTVKGDVTGIEDGGNYVITLLNTNKTVLGTTSTGSAWGTTTINTRDTGEEVYIDEASGDVLNLWTLKDTGEVDANNAKLYWLYNETADEYIALTNKSNESTANWGRLVNKNNAAKFTLSWNGSYWLFDDEVGNNLHNLADSGNIGAYNADGQSSQFSLYKVAVETVGHTDITFTGVTKGETIATIGNTKYHINVIDSVNVSLHVGEDKNLVDNTGAYTTGNVTGPEGIVGMEVSENAAVTQKDFSEEIIRKADFRDGKNYVLVSERSDTEGLLTTESYTAQLTWGSRLNIIGLNTHGAVSVNSEYVWKIIPEGDGVYIKSGDQYLTLAYNTSANTSTAGLQAAPEALTLEYEDGYWYIQNSANAYLSNVGGFGNGYYGASGFNETGGSGWKIYEVVETVTSSANTEITFTGLKVGKTTAKVGNLTYNICVCEEEFGPKNIVVDFGLPVQVHYNAWLNAKGTAPVELTGATATYGTVSIEGAATDGWTITYTPNKVLQGVDTVTLTDGTNDYTFKVYPATSVYYDATFTERTSENNTWSAETQTGTQTVSIVGNEDNGNYGYEAAYEDSASVTSTGLGDIATFNFKGTGVDIFANCTTTSGMALVQVKVINGETQQVEKMQIVNTAVIVDEEGDDSKLPSLGMLNNVPIISVSGLDYGTHTVQINHVNKTNVQDGSGIDPLIIDGFRVYDTLKEDEDAESVYAQDGESNPVYIGMRDQLITSVRSKLESANATEAAADIAEQVANSEATTEGAVILSGNDSNYTEDELDAFINNSSKNELYLYPNQALVFSVTNTKNLQLGLRALAGSVDYTVNSGEKQTLDSKVDMFYPITGSDSDQDGSYTVTIANNSPYNFEDADAVPAVLAITKLKATNISAENPTIAMAALTEEDYAMAFASLGYDFDPEGGNEEPETPASPEIQGVSRIYGADRYETSYAVAEEYKELLNVNQFDTVIITTGKKSADALSGSYLAVMNNAPILLTNEKRVDEVVAYVQANLKAGGTVYVLGGDAAVPAAVDRALETEYTVKRLAGADRYETNRMILEEAGVNGRELLIATGKDFADSLSASATKRPILLVKDEITDAHRAILRKYDGGKLYILGGEGAVSAEVEEALVGHGQIFRVSGASRYETSVEIAKRFFEEPVAVTLAYAKEAPDGLCGGPLAALLNAPLILTADQKTAAASEYVQAEGIESGYVFGGDSRISDEAVDEIFK